MPGERVARDCVNRTGRDMLTPPCVGFSAPPADAVALLPQILDIEYRVYEPARRTPPDDIRAALLDEQGVTSVAEIQERDDWVFVGFGIGQPLERAADNEEGPDRDPMLGRNNTLYSLSITVSPEYQGLGIGRLIKEHQIAIAAERRTADGKPRYRYVTGRNRVGPEGVTPAGRARRPRPVHSQLWPGRLPMRVSRRPSSVTSWRAAGAPRCTASAPTSTQCDPTRTLWTWPPSRSACSTTVTS